MSGLSHEQAMRLAEGFNELSRLHRERSKTTAEVLRLCRKHLDQPSPFSSAEQLVERRNERAALVKMLSDAIQLFEETTNEPTDQQHP